MSEELEFPTIPDDLVTALDQRFPEKTPDPSWTDREIWMKAGERRLYRFLERERKRQVENLRI